MLKNTQVNQEWAKDIMTSCHEKHRIWKDYIERWGCLVTSLANIMCYTPRELNQTIRREKAYKYLDDNNTPENQASFLMLDKIKKTLGISIINNLGYKYYYEEQGTCWIARIIHRTGGGHYINVLRKEANTWIVYDVENGREKRLQNKDITKLIKVVL